MPRPPTWRDIFRSGAPLITVAGAQFQLPRHTARRWIAAILSRDLEEIVPGLLAAPDWDRWADQVVLNDDILWTPDTLGYLAQSIVVAASSWSWPATVRLIGQTRHDWREWRSWCLAKGIGDPLRLPLDSYCDLSYYSLVTHANDEQRARIDFDLEAPLPAQTPEQIAGTTVRVSTGALPDGRTPPPGWDDGTDGGWGAALANNPTGRAGRDDSR